MATILQPSQSETAPVRATEIRTLRGILGVYFRAPSAQIVFGASVVATVIRLILGNFGWHDFAAIAVVAVLTGTIEWIIHKFLLHAPEESFRTRVLKTSSAHRSHHADPTLLRNVLLGSLDAVSFLPGIALFSAVWSVPMAFVAGFPLLSTFLTGVTLSWWALAHYEWVHLAVHTGYRFKNPIYGRLQRNHRLHHYRNEDYWLGVTSNSGDRLLGTLPSHKSDVELSPTARSLS